MHHKQKKVITQLNYHEAMQIINNLKNQLSDAIEDDNETLCNDLSNQINDIELLINEYESSIKDKKKIDFLNPSEQMISEAKEKGIDLNDIKYYYQQWKLSVSFDCTPCYHHYTFLP